MGYIEDSYLQGSTIHECQSNVTKHLLLIYKIGVNYSRSGIRHLFFCFFFCSELSSPTINMSLKSGQFPVAWKEALVLPLLKKPGLDILFKNFRPVSNLPFVSKLTESAVYNQTHSHICRNNLYPANQSSYRKNYSTETALLSEK